MPFITLRDGAQFYYKDWNHTPEKGQPTVVFSHGWPLSSDCWEAQMFFLASRGCRVIAHDRRGHGRSEQTWANNDVDSWADDLAELLNALNVKGAILVGHSTGGGEIVRYCARHGMSRVSKLVLIASIVPQLVQSASSPDGVPPAVLDSFRAAMEKDRAQFFLDVPTGPFFGYNRPGVKVSQGMIQAWFAAGMQSGFKGVYETCRSWEVDYSEDLRAIAAPTLFLHGDDDQIAPFPNGSPRAVKIAQNGTLKVYEGGAHGLPNTEPDRVNADLWEFIQA